MGKKGRNAELAKRKPKKLSLTGGTGPRLKPKHVRKRPPPEQDKLPPTKKPKLKEHEPDEEDKQFFQEHGQFLQFLDRMKPDELSLSISKSKKDKPEKPSSSLTLEEQYEAGIASEEEDKAIKPRLPLKFGDRIVETNIDSDEEREEIKRRAEFQEDKAAHIEQRNKERREKRKAAIRAKKGLPPVNPKEGSESDSGTESLEETLSETSLDDGEKDLTEIDPDMLEVEIFARRQNEIAKQKEVIAVAINKVLEEPEKNISKLTQVRMLISDADDVTVRKLACLSLMKVFCDILPSYRIITDLDTGVQLSKDVKALREYENQLLKSYQSYLQVLEELVFYTKEILKAQVEEARPLNSKPSIWVKSKVDISSMTQTGINAMLGLGRVAASALGELLWRMHHFNFRSNIIACLVPLMNTADPELAKIVQTSFEKLFKEDYLRGETSLEAVRAIAQLAKKKEYKLRPGVLDVLVHLPLRTAMADDDSIFQPTRALAKAKKHMSNAERKRAKKEAALDKEMAQVDAEESVTDRRVIQTETLKSVFLIYFRMLKSKRMSPVLSTVLEGMAKFSHLINLDLLLNLIENLKEILSNENISVDSSLHTAVTAFQAIKLQGDSLTVDLKEFYSRLYAVIEKVGCTPSRYSSLMPLLIRALNLMFTDKRVLSMDRVAAYVKRLLTISLQLPPQGVLAILLVLNQILRRYPKTQQLLDTEFNAMGVYVPDADPEHCNPFATTAWEFLVLLNHCHPSVVNLAKMVFNQDPIAEQDVLKIYKQFDFVTHGIVPSMKQPKIHTFVKANSKALKAGRHNVYYIQPNSLYEQSEFSAYLETQKEHYNKVLMDEKIPAKSLTQHFEDLQSLMEYQDEDVISIDGSDSS